MLGRVAEKNKSSLARLKWCLQRYSDALVDWQMAIDEAECRIETLTPVELQELSYEVGEIQKSREELIALRHKVEAGWAMYEKLSHKSDSDDDRTGVVVDAHAVMSTIQQQAERTSQFAGRPPSKFS